MHRRTQLLVSVALILTAGSARAQSGDAAIESYFAGKQVVLKIDMPGSQKGVDLRFDKATPMDWKEYSSRVRDFGVSIRKGDTARVTTIVVKKDMIEFQLDGGGFGTARDDTKTTVEPKVAEKSSYEKDLEAQIAATDDPDRKADLQRDLDRERARRAREDAANKREAQAASVAKAEQVADNRMRGGSRFNLRWKGSIPAGADTPDGVMKLLAEYVQFGGDSGAAVRPAQQNGENSRDSGAAPSSALPSNAPPAEQDASPTARLKRGMKISEVADLLGAGKKLSVSGGDNGLETIVMEYLVDDRRVEATYVDGILIRFTISSR
jgi:sRNA-binding protein